VGDCSCKSDSHKAHNGRNAKAVGSS
jgi:hypothetical protein